MVLLFTVMMLVCGTQDNKTICNFCFNETEKEEREENCCDFISP